MHHHCSLIPLLDFLLLLQLPQYRAEVASGRLTWDPRQADVAAAMDDLVTPVPLPPLPPLPPPPPLPPLPPLPPPPPLPSLPPLRPLSPPYSHPPSSPPRFES
ncbi:unnamed protein product [Closterium sp. Naga37s-1]|nr:unnamed protein product [Closterium sp. Naga37s-1]